ncbi:MAG: hypothetical protein MZV64_27000 [Ignavibacteriales bacterium]|nr:hypothetical protein [Ignavibacteriales bacterium]
MSLAELEQKSLEVPDGKVEIATILNMPSFTPFTVARVNVLVNGKITKTFGVPLKITVYDYVWVSKETINRDSSLTHSNIALEKKELGLMSEHAIRSDFPVYDCRARKTFRPGDIIDIRYIDSCSGCYKE